MLDTILTILSFPFWFFAFMFAVTGVFGTVKMNGVQYRGKYLFAIKTGVTMFGLFNGLIAYGLVVIM